VIWCGKKHTVDISRPSKGLKEICNRHSILLIRPKRRYNRYTYDYHTNKLGNFNMAQDIVDFLIEEELLYNKAGEL
jgi:hypothetical protein